MAVWLSEVSFHRVKLVASRLAGWRATMTEQTQAGSRGKKAVRTAQKPRRTIRVPLAAALAAGALVTVSIGLLERHMLASPHPISYFHLFFSDPLYMKAWLASAALVLSFGQLVTAAGMYGALRISPATRFYHLVHRWSGR